MSDFPLPPLLTPQQARELRIRETLARIEATAPAWSKVPPWVAEKMFQRAEQKELFNIANLPVGNPKISKNPEKNAITAKAGIAQGEAAKSLNVSRSAVQRAEQRELFTKNGGRPGKEKPANETGKHNEFTRTK